MPNTNFQTVHQFGAGISQVVRQATGRDPVQNIDMEHVTVAQAKRLRVVDTFTGNPITISDGKSGEIIGAEVEMWIKQNLNGQNHPWPAGCGNNRFNPETVVKVDGVLANCVINSVTGAAILRPESSAFWVSSDYIPVTPGEVLYCGEAASDSVNAGSAFYDASKTYISGVSATQLSVDNVLEVPETAAYMRHSFSVASNPNWDTTIYITLNSNPHAFTPYENICPITPWASVLITVNDEEHLTEFPQSVYLGSFNTLTGQLVITSALTTVGDCNWVYRTSPSRCFTSLPGVLHTDERYQLAVVSSAYKSMVNRDPSAATEDFSIWGQGGANDYVYIRDSRFTTAASFKTAMGDTQICYPLQDPIILQLTKEQIPAAEGENTVSTNANTLTVTLYEAV